MIKSEKCMELNLHQLAFQAREHKWNLFHLGHKLHNFVINRRRCVCSSRGCSPDWTQATWKRSDISLSQRALCGCTGTKLTRMYMLVLSLLRASSAAVGFKWQPPPFFHFILDKYPSSHVHARRIYEREPLCALYYAKYLSLCTCKCKFQCEK